jgi:hypothetical protein
MLGVDSLQATPGGGAGTGGSPLSSSVFILVATPAPPHPVVFADAGSAVLAVVMKDVTVAPTTNNQVTISNYHVAYRRADGRNTPGVDVPYPFDGAVTLTIAAGGTGTVAFEIVRTDAKLESPLLELRTNPGVINTIGDVTFYGRDTVGNDVSVTGSIGINFGNFSGG